MADTKITSLQPPQVGYPVVPATDVLPIVVIADPGMATSGSTRKVTVNQLLGAGGTATLASATITGDLTVDTSTLKVNATNDRVGIGTASPGKRCEINQSANAITTIGAGEILRLIGDDGNVVSRITEVGFGSGPTGATYAPVVIGAVNTSISGFGTKDFYVATRAGIGDVAPLERYRIDSTGVSTWSVGGSTAMTLNSTGLGVGVTPTEKLSVWGTPTVYGDGRFNVGLFDPTSATTGTGSGISFAGYTNGTTVGATFAQIKGIKENSTAGNIAGALVISTLPNGGTPVERLRIDSAGNCGIGVAPSAYGTGIKGLDIGAWTSTAQIGAASFYGFNSYASTTGQFNYKNNGAIALGYFQTTSGHLWLNAPSNAGAAGANATFTTVMTLDPNGNLILLPPSTPPTLATNGQLTVNATSNTNLRFSYRGSDGVTRTANLTLA